ncbi:MAG TPA: hypothetical protein VFZ91_15720 [Allosphingosinicella sp.]
MNARWAEFISSPAARRATIVLLVLQTGGCAVDLAAEQVWLMSAICLASASALAELLAFLLWLALALSWAVGLLAIRLPSARPAYWALLAAIPTAHLVQTSLLRRGVLSCDGP